VTIHTATLPETEDDQMAAQSPGCPVISKKYRIDFSDSDVTVGTTAAEIFNYDGTGKLFGFVFEFTGEVSVELDVDGEIIFDLSTSDINDMQIPMGISGAIPAIPGSLEWTSASKKLVFMPPCPILYGTNVTVNATRLATPDKTMTRSIVSLTKET